jgi:hypothetical protein
MQLKVGDKVRHVFYADIGTIVEILEENEVLVDYSFTKYGNVIDSIYHLVQLTELEIALL